MESNDQLSKLQSRVTELERMVSERAERIKELEKRRADSEKLVATGRMAAWIAHEINNPLGGIKNSFLLVKDAIRSDHPHYSYVERIEREIDRIAAIVRRMFDLYSPDKTRSVEVSVNEAVQCLP
jgi:nitrogen-specific signal transduction histidine kinase